MEWRGRRSLRTAQCFDAIQPDGKAYARYRLLCAQHRQQAIIAAAACQRAGVYHRLKILPGRGHGFDNNGLADPEISAVFDEAIAFMRQAAALELDEQLLAN